MSEMGPNTPSEKEIRDLLPGYVLGTLEPGELLVVNDYLTLYPDLLEEVRVLEQTTMQLAYSAPPALPPSGSRERIFARAKVDAEQNSIQIGTNSAGARSSRSNDVSSTRRKATPERLFPAPSPQGTAATSKAGARSTVRPPISSGPDHALQPPRPRRSLLQAFREWWNSALGWKMYALATTAALALLYIFFNQGQNALEQSVARLDSVSAEIASLEAERDTATSQLSALLGQVDELTGQVEAQSASIDELNRSNNQLVQTANELGMKNDELVEANNGLQTANAELVKLEEEMVALQAANSELQTANAELEAILIGLQEQSRDQGLILALFPSINRIAALQGSDQASGAGGSLWTGPEGGYLVLSGLEPLPENQIYQLWLNPDGADPVDSGLITVSSTDSVVISVALSLDIDEFTTVGLSIEPTGGSDAPTGDIVLLGSQA